MKASAWATQRSDTAGKLSRRHFLLASGTLAAATIGLASPWVGCGRSPRDAIEAALGDLYGDPEDASSVAARAGWSRERARSVVAGSLSAGELEALARDPAVLRAHLDKQRHRELAEGRIVWVGPWALPETEVAIAVLMSPADG